MRVVAASRSFSSEAMPVFNSAHSTSSAPICKTSDRLTVSRGAVAEIG
jgi:hypothetical protein